VGQVYTTLQRLERDGMVESDDAGADEGPQRTYRITEPGERELRVWLTTPPEVTQPPRDELLIKVLVATQVPGIDVRDVVQVHRRHLIEVMQQYTSLKADAPSDDLALSLVLDAELFRLEAAVRWLDSADARLRQRAEAGGGEGASTVASRSPRRSARAGRLAARS
jgi:DNA-binding PadR family transcriptional regulator